jgi:hypothetical protein
MQIQFEANGPRCAVITRTGVLLHSFEHSMPQLDLVGDLGGALRHGAISSDGRWLAVGGLTRLGLWDLSQQAPPTMAVEAEHARAFFSPDASELFAFWTPGHARWRIQPGAAVGAPPTLTPLPTPKAGRIMSGQFTSNSLILGTDQGVLILPKSDVLAEGFQSDNLRDVPGEVSPNGTLLALRFLRAMPVYELNPWKKVQHLAFDVDLLAHTFTPKGDELVVANRTGVTFLDTDRWKAQRTMPITLDRNTRLIFAPDGRTFWLARDASTGALHDTKTFETLLPLPNGMTPLALSPDAHHLVVSVDGQRLQVWDLTEVWERFRELGVDWVKSGP